MNLRNFNQIFYLRFLNDGELSHYSNINESIFKIGFTTQDDFTRRAPINLCYRTWKVYEGRKYENHIRKKLKEKGFIQVNGSNDYFVGEVMECGINL